MSFTYSVAHTYIRNAINSFQTAANHGFIDQPTGFLDALGQTQVRRHTMLLLIQDNSGSHGVCYYNAILDCLSAADERLAMHVQRSIDIGESETLCVLEYLTRAHSYYQEVIITRDTYSSGASSYIRIAQRSMGQALTYFKNTEYGKTWDGQWRYT